MLTPAVASRGVTRRFGLLIANDDVSSVPAPWEIHLGENGAGKNSLMRVRYAPLQPDDCYVGWDYRFHAAV